MVSRQELQVSGQKRLKITQRPSARRLLLAETASWKPRVGIMLHKLFSYAEKIMWERLPAHCFRGLIGGQGLQWVLVPQFFQTFQHVLGNVSYFLQSQNEEQLVVL